MHVRRRERCRTTVSGESSGEIRSVRHSSRIQVALATPAGQGCMPWLLAKAAGAATTLAAGGRCLKTETGGTAACCKAQNGEVAAVEKVGAADIGRESCPLHHYALAALVLLSLPASVQLGRILGVILLALFVVELYVIII